VCRATRRPQAPTAISSSDGALTRKPHRHAMVTSYAAFPPSALTPRRWSATAAPSSPAPPISNTRLGAIRTVVSARAAPTRRRPGVFQEMCSKVVTELSRAWNDVLRIVRGELRGEPACRGPRGGGLYCKDVARRGRRVNVRFLLMERQGENGFCSNGWSLTRTGSRVSIAPAS
jgi:hypothetical protein